MAADRAAEGTNRAVITVCVILATVMQALDTTIANIALPHIQGSVSASQDQINWVLTSYIVAAAIMTPLTGFLAGRFGRKRLFLAAVAGFTVASMLCGMAQSLVQIVLFRTLQGMFGAALVPLSQSVLIDINPQERRGSAMALLASRSWSDPSWGQSSVAGSQRIILGAGFSTSTCRSEPSLSSASLLSCRTPTETPVRSWTGSVSGP